MDILSRIKAICLYSPSSRMLREGWDKDTEGYVCIGEVRGYFPWSGGDSDSRIYIMASPEKTMIYGEMSYDICYTENEDGTGRQTSSIPAYAKDRITVYPQYRDTEYGEMLLGKRKADDEIDAGHSKFESMLFTYGDNVILHHNSSFRTEDGVIRRGKVNPWSNNSDEGVYFWGSRNSGSDPSGSGRYTYYCLAARDDIYDFDTNEERLTLRQALARHRYVGQRWKYEDCIVINTYTSTPIWCILDRRDGTWYDAGWNEIEKPF